MVNRCICSNISFEKIKDLADKKEFQTIEELQSAEICAVNCCLCVPYISEMLKTGQTAFHPFEIEKPATR